jgi:hypothetical protein
VKSFGTNYSKTQCIPRISLKIVWHKSLDILNSSATSQTVSRDFHG